MVVWVKNMPQKPVWPGISNTGLPGDGLRVPLICENTVGLSSTLLPGLIDTGVCSFAISAEPISTWP